jgi:DNA-dependent metalloprotease WSS1
VRLRPSHSPGSFHDFETCMDTMLHELVHNVHGEHDKSFYALLEEITAEWQLLSSKGYRGEGFFSQGQRLGNGHVFYKPKTALSPADRRRIRDRAENDRKGIHVSPVGQRLGGPTLGPQMEGDTAVGGVRLGGVGVGGVMDPRRLAAMAAERRAMDQKSCGAKQAVGDMRRETEKAQREGTMTQSKDMPTIIDLDDLDNYDLDLDIPSSSTTSLPAKPTSVNTASSTWTESDGGWVCSECTFRNPAMYLACSVCQNAKSMGSDDGNIIDLTGDIGSSWDCGLCTFRNENVTDGKCGVCGTEMP